MNNARCKRKIQIKAIDFGESSAGQTYSIGSLDQRDTAFTFAHRLLLIAAGWLRRSCFAEIDRMCDYEQRCGNGLPVIGIEGPE